MACNTENSVVTIEAVESRLMLSATAAPHIKLADPVTTDKSITYKNFSADPLFSAAGPSINDINQGELGDCYLLSTLSSIANTDAGLIKHDVVENSNSTYSVTFGKSAAITVNANLPVLADGQLAYAQLGAGNSIWVAIVEKAYAEFKNPKVDSYATINGGWMGDVFSAMGISNQSTYATKSAASLVTTLTADLKAHDFTTFATASKLAKDSPLVAGHAYEVNSMNIGANGAVESITLRNPWGNGSANDGYVTLTATQAFAAFAGVVTGHT